MVVLKGGSWMIMERIDIFVQLVSAKSELQKRYLSDWQACDAEKRELASILNFYCECCDFDIEFIADSYIFINEMIIDEQYYFARNGKYRNSTFEEVNKRVYQNQEYMMKYMIGLTISDYIWIQHLEMIRYFEKLLEDSKLSRGRYLEIGPGFGQFLTRAIKKDLWEEYLAIDISPVSVEQCRKYLKYCSIKDSGCVNIALQDFFLFDTDVKFENVVCGEVLEHVEDPLKMLKKIYFLLSKGGTAFITTVINAPAVDHIYLFSTAQEVLDMAKAAGFAIYDYMCAAAGGTVEAAEKKKRTINIALLCVKE